MSLNGRPEMRSPTTDTNAPSPGAEVLRSLSDQAIRRRYSSYGTRRASWEFPYRCNNVYPAIKTDRKMSPKNKKITRSGTHHKCPMCGRGFAEVKAFVQHVDSHDWTVASTAPASPLQVRVEAVILGLSSTAIWEFLKWCIENNAADFVNQVLGSLFGLHMPMGVSRPEHARDCVERWLQDEDSRIEALGWINTDRLGNNTLLALCEALTTWMSRSTDIMPGSDFEAWLRTIAAERANECGAVSTEAAVATANLASLLNAKQQYDEAESLYIEALRVHEQVRGEDAPWLVSALSDLGRISESRIDVAGFVHGGIFTGLVVTDLPDSVMEHVSRTLLMYKNAILVSERIFGRSSTAASNLARHFEEFVDHWGDNPSAPAIQACWKKRWNNGPA
jgi:uncharacterized C2H2 Zn-finger protein